MARWLVGFDLSEDTPERLENLTQRLLAELRELGAVRVDRVRGRGPDGAKSGAALEIGQLVLSGIFSAATATACAKVLVARFDQAKARRVSIERDGEKVEFDGLTAKDQHLLVEAIAAKLLDEAAPDGGASEQR
ncbi:effector-associated constant component EACC1 [Saccharopolyspora shandongensis]|uniref:effector-associated constant component EACC1 n=1 Tax=Saccharopolyspora shandongensis TaxID=418495 RepID=UPI0033C8D95D